MKQKPSPAKNRQRYSAGQIEEALEIIARCGRDFNIAADRTGIKSATLKAWWYKNNAAVEERPGPSSESISAPPAHALPATGTADRRSLDPLDDTRRQNLQAIGRTLGRCIARIYEILPDCQNLHLISEATRAVAEAYKTVATENPKDDEAETAKVTNNFTSIIAQINAAQKDQSGK